MFPVLPDGERERRGEQGRRNPRPCGVVDGSLAYRRTIRRCGCPGCGRPGGLMPGRACGACVRGAPREAFTISTIAFRRCIICVCRFCKLTACACRIDTTAPSRRSTRAARVSSCPRRASAPSSEATFADRAFISADEAPPSAPDSVADAAAFGPLSDGASTEGFAPARRASISPCDSTLLAATLVPVCIVGLTGDGTPRRRYATVCAHASTVQRIAHFVRMLPGIYRSGSTGRLQYRSALTPPSRPQSRACAGKTTSSAVQTRSPRRPATSRFRL